MEKDGPADRTDSALLSRALRTVRIHRRMSPKAVATAMNLALRTYQRFEAGETRLNLDHIHRFAAATRSDPHAILMAVAIGSPEHARHACDNQLDTILTVAMREFDERLGERVRELDSRTIIAAVVAMFEGLEETLGPDDPARAWLDRGENDLTARRPKPGR